MEPMGYQAPAYPTSCLSAAWADIKATPNYVSRLIVLGLIMCVPILNFVVAGYFLLWAREVPFGGRTPLPAQMVTGKTFEFGFYAFVLTLVVGMAGGIASSIVGWVPLLGWIASILIMLLVAVAGSVMQMRMIMGLSLGEGFNVMDIWEKGKRNWSQLLLAVLVPQLVVGVIITALTFVVMMLGMVLGLGGAVPSIMALSNAADPSFAQTMSLIGAIAVPMLICGLIVYVAVCIAEVVAEALVIRGLGHWVARYAPEWTTLAVPQAPQIPPVSQTPQTPTF